MAQADQADHWGQKGRPLGGRRSQDCGFHGPALQCSLGSVLPLPFPGNSAAPKLRLVSSDSCFPNLYPSAISLSWSSDLSIPPDLFAYKSHRHLHLVSLVGICLTSCIPNLLLLHVPYFSKWHHHPSSCQSHRSVGCSSFLLFLCTIHSQSQSSVPSICDILESSCLSPSIPSIAQFVLLFLTWWPPNSDICFLLYSLQIMGSYTEARIIFLNHQPPVLPCQFSVYWFCIVFTLISERWHRIFLASYEEPHLPSSPWCTVFSNRIIWILISQTIRVAPVSPLFLLL